MIKAGDLELAARGGTMAFIKLPNHQNPKALQVVEEWFEQRMLERAPKMSTRWRRFWQWRIFMKTPKILVTYPP